MFTNERRNISHKQLLITEDDAEQTKALHAFFASVLKKRFNCDQKAKAICNGKKRINSSKSREFVPLKAWQGSLKVYSL